VDNLTKEFLAESSEGLDRMEACLAEFEIRHGNDDLAEEIFRCVPAKKETTGLLGFYRLAEAGLLRDNVTKS
jgi:two-component system chemotaxis sensor kinase CheA